MAFVDWVASRSVFGRGRRGDLQDLTPPPPLSQNSSSPNRKKLPSV